MKLLIDANLSYRLVKKLKSYYPQCIYVSSLDLDRPAKDIDIWNWAKKNNYIIVTNDEDFENLSDLNGFPPKIILLKTGNQSTNFIADVLINKSKVIDKFVKNDELGLLEII